MKLISILISTFVVSMASSAYAAEAIKSVNIGKAEVFYELEPIETGGMILTLNALVSETNNALRGLKNTDRRRLGKLGQLIYQCKLMLYKAEKTESKPDSKDLILVSKNYSLFTGVDLPLATDERMGIQTEALQIVNDASLFNATFGNKNLLKKSSETVGGDNSINLRQFDINVLIETDLIETSESIDIIARFPVFQLEKPVSQWSYNFNLKDFKQAIHHIDENCTQTRFNELIKQKT